MELLAGLLHYTHIMAVCRLNTLKHTVRSHTYKCGDVELWSSNQRKIISVDGVQQFIWPNSELQRVPSRSAWRRRVWGIVYDYGQKCKTFNFLACWLALHYLRHNNLATALRLVDLHQRFFTRCFTAAHVDWVHVPTSGWRCARLHLLMCMCVCACEWGGQQQRVKAARTWQLPHERAKWRKRKKSVNNRISTRTDMHAHIHMYTNIYICVHMLAIMQL